MAFELGRLPPEVRQLIWEETLPGRRVFHVSKLTDAHADPPRTGHTNTEWREQILNFHIRHAPPAAHAVCRESRAVLLLRGTFLSPSSSSSPGPWFNPQRDVLYLDRNMRRCLTSKTEPLRIAGLDRMLHVGLEWRAWFRDVPRLPGGGDDAAARRRWSTAMVPLLRHCPRAETMGFVLPRVRHVGGVPSGREPYRAEHHRCELAPLPADVRVPWERVPVQVANGALVPAAGGYTGTALAQLGGASVLVPWGAIRAQMEAAASGFLQEEGGGVEDEGFHEPQPPRRKALSVQGWWLVRPEAPIGQEDQQVREFWS